MPTVEISNRITGGHLRTDAPVWDPLLALARHDDLIMGRFMWMCSCRLSDGRRLHVYKDKDTRRSIHLTDEGDALVYCCRGWDGSDWYEPVALGRALRAVFCPHRELGYGDEVELAAVDDLMDRHSLRPRDPLARPLAIALPAVVVPPANDNGLWPSYRGRVTTARKPNMGPLRRLVADDDRLAGQFRWVRSVRLEDLRLVCVYEHRATGELLHLDEDLIGFDVHPEDEQPYRTVSLGHALGEVLCQIRESEELTDTEILAAEALIERHARHPRRRLSAVA